MTVDEEGSTFQITTHARQPVPPRQVGATTCDAAGRLGVNPRMQVGSTLRSHERMSDRQRASRNEPLQHTKR